MLITLTRLTTFKRQCWQNAQYSRRECLDIVGIPRKVSGEVLEEKFLKILVVISHLIVEECHCVGRTTNTVIVEFSKRKIYQDTWSVKKNLKKLTMEEP